MPLNMVREPLSQKDIIYFAITDRFNDGNRQNNSAPPPVDKSDSHRYHGGDFAGITEKIPYLANLGITALWITPVYLSIGTYQAGSYAADGYHGYWTLDFEKIDPHLTEGSSGKAELKKLADRLHEHNIKLILDMVVNHTGYHNDTYSRYPGRQIPGAWFKANNQWDLYGLPKLDHLKADVRDYFVNNIIDWIEEGDIDAIRMDSVPYVDHDFWYYFKSYVRGKYRNVFFLGEDLEFDEDRIAVYQREHDFDSLFDFPLRRNIIDVLIRNEDYKPAPDRRGMMAIAAPRTGTEPEGVLDADTKYNNANRLVTLTDNHDLEKRLMSWALLYSGNDRQKAAQLVKYVLTFQLTTRGIPQIYYGTEIGLEGEQDHGGDAHLRKDMPWEVFDENTNEPKDSFTVEKEIFRHLQKLIRIRKENEALPFGYLFTLYSDYFVYAYMREFRGNTIIVVMNNGTEPMPNPLAIDIASNANVPSRIKSNLAQQKVLVNLLNPQDRISYRDQGQIVVQLAGKTAKAYKLNHR